MNYFNNYYLFSTNVEGIPPRTEEATQRWLGSALGEKRAWVEEASTGHHQDTGKPASCKARVRREYAYIHM